MCEKLPKTPAVLLNRTGPTYQYDGYLNYDTSDYVSNQDKKIFKDTFVGSNPKLRDAFRPEPIPLDRPPLMTELLPEEIYQPRPSLQYGCYSDISYGNVYYWLPKNAGQVYSSTLFTTPADVQRSVRVDPMGVIMPEYSRSTQKPYCWSIQNSKDCNSSTHDELEFRQSIMISQMRKRNQQESKYYV